MNKIYAHRYIQSHDNPFLKELLKLSSSARNRGKAGQTLLEGTHLLAACLDAGITPLHIILAIDALQNKEVLALLDQAKAVPVTLLDERLFDELSELKTPTGLLALIAVPQPTGTIADSQFVVMLEDIQDPGNLGTMLRSAAAAGCDSVYLSKRCADAWSPRVLRAAMGGHFALQIFENQDLVSLTRAFSGLLLAASLQSSRSLYECDLRGKLAFLIGNEGAGLSPELMSMVTQTFIIPMPGRVESLNAATAVAIGLFEAVRQRLAR